MGPKLRLYKKYRISNADVRHTAEKFRIDDLKLQWVIGTDTVVEEIDEDDSGVLPFRFTFTEYKDLGHYADSTNETVGQCNAHFSLYYIYVKLEIPQCRCHWRRCLTNSFP